MEKRELNEWKEKIGIKDERTCPFLNVREGYEVALVGHMATFGWLDDLFKVLIRLEFNFTWIIRDVNDKL